MSLLLHAVGIGRCTHANFKGGCYISSPGFSSSTSSVCQSSPFSLSLFLYLYIPCRIDGIETSLPLNYMSEFSLVPGIQRKALKELHIRQAQSEVQEELSLRQRVNRKNSKCASCLTGCWAFCSISNPHYLCKSQFLPCQTSLAFGWTQKSRSAHYKLMSPDIWWKLVYSSLWLALCLIHKASKPWSTQSIEVIWSPLKGS